MIPRIWRYLFIEQLKMTGLSWPGSMLLFTLLRIEEIARFASLGPPLEDILRFTAILLPQLAILAIPLAILFGTYITWNRFSQSCELLGALTCGIRLEHLIFPTLCLALLLSAISGYIALDPAPKAQLEAKRLKTYWSRVNPTHLLRSERIWQLPGATLISRQRPGDLEAFIVSHHTKQQSSQLIHIDRLQVNSQSKLLAQDSTHIIFHPVHHAQYLSLESISRGNYNYILGDPENEVMEIAPDQLPLSSLLSRLKSRELIDKKELRKLWLEIPRRLFFWILPLSFAALALVAGFHPDKRATAPSMKPIGVWVMVLLISYFITKGLNPALPLGLALYLGLPLISIGWCLRRIRKTGVCT